MLAGPRKRKDIAKLGNKEVDMSVVNETLEIREKQLAKGKSIAPHELHEMDVRARSGEDYSDDIISIDGVNIFIPQLTTIDVRKADLRGMASIEDARLGAKIINAMRTKASSRELKVELSPQEVFLWSESTIEKDVWLVFFALKKAKHPKIVGNMEVDRDFIENLQNFDEIAETIKKVNAIGPEGAEEVKFFPSNDDGSTS